MNHNWWSMNYESESYDFFQGYNHHVLEMHPFALVFIFVVPHNNNIPFRLLERQGWVHLIQVSLMFKVFSKTNPARVINIFNRFYPHLQLPWRSYMPDIEFTNSAKVSSTLITLTKKSWTNEKSFIFKRTSWSDLIVRKTN